MPAFIRQSVRRLHFGLCMLLAVVGMSAIAGAAHAEDNELILPLEDLPAIVSAVLHFAPPTNTTPSGTGTPGGRQFGPITVQKFSHLQWSLDGNYLRAQGGVEVVYTDPTTHELTQLSADTMEYNAENAIVQAHGKVHIERPEGTFSGDAVTFNFQSRAGFVTGASIISDYFRVSGERIETQANGTYVVYNGSFTTCNRYHPDYHIRAKKLTIVPGKYISARKVTFYAGRTSLPTLPYFRRNLRSGSSNALNITPGYNRSEGITLRFQDSPIVQPNQTFDYDLHVNVKKFPTGFLAYQRDISPTPPGSPAPRGFLPTLDDPLRGTLEQFIPPTYQEYSVSRYFGETEKRTTAFATLEREQYVYNRRRTDLSVSRFPEVGVRFSNILGRPFEPSKTDTAVAGETDYILRKIPGAPFLLDFEASVAAIQERPTYRTEGRIATRTNFASQPYSLGRRLSARAGVTDWLNFYSSIDGYNVFSPEVELDYVPTKTSIFNVGYRYLTDFGKTPFVFDHRDIRHELRFQYQVGGPWAFGYLSRIDLERSRAYDAEYAVVRNFDCMQVGLAYRLRSQSINIIFNLVPPARNRERRMPLGRTVP